MFRKLILWVFLRFRSVKFDKSTENVAPWKFKTMTEEKRAVLIFELGSLQVYHYQTPEETAANKPYSSVYWQDRDTKQVYGPFPSVYEAMSHYTWNKSVEKGNQNTGKVIRVDFKTKKKLESKNI